MEFANNLCSTLSCTVAAFWKINKTIILFYDYIQMVIFYPGCYAVQIVGVLLLLEKLYKMPKQAIKIVFDTEPFSETKYLFKNNGFMILPNFYYVIDVLKFLKLCQVTYLICSLKLM